MIHKDMRLLSQTALSELIDTISAGRFVNSYAGTYEYSEKCHVCHRRKKQAEELLNRMNQF